MVKEICWLIDWLNILKSENNIKIFSGVDGKVSQSEQVRIIFYLESLSYLFHVLSKIDRGNIPLILLLHLVLGRSINLYALTCKPIIIEMSEFKVSLTFDTNKKNSYELKVLVRFSPNDNRF